MGSDVRTVVLLVWPDGRQRKGGRRGTAAGRARGRVQGAVDGQAKPWDRLATTVNHLSLYFLIKLFQLLSELRQRPCRQSVS